MPLKICTQRGSSTEFWEKFYHGRFKRESLEEYYQNFRKPYVLQEIFTKYLPKKGKILDAGCGPGVWTYWFIQREYDAEGIDISENAIDLINKKLPKLPVTVGDIFNLNYRNDSLMGYVSLGVIGFFEKGLKEGLQEAARVLKQDGIMILRVPYYNPLRKLKKLLGFYQNQKCESYQYAFTMQEITEEMNTVGLRVVANNFYDSIHGIREEIFGMDKLQQLALQYEKDPRGETIKKSRPFYWTLLERASTMFPVRFLFASNLIIVAKKL